MLAVVSHDAGGAEILSSFVRQQGMDAVFVLQGPARAVFERKLGSIEITSLESAIRKSESVLTGTSWQSDLEFNAIRAARRLFKRSATFIDHWVNYVERFTRHGTTLLPDELWVGDAVAESIAAMAFPGTPIRLIDNPYFKEIREALAKKDRPRHNPRGLSVLYVCEPVREHALRHYGDERHFGYVEEEAVRFFLKNATALQTPIERILIRPHPSDPSDKYEWAREEFDLPIEMGGTRGLLDEIADCDVVVGCESMAMVVGLLAGKRVLSAIPPSGNACRLPQPEIERYEELIREMIRNRI